MSVEAVHLRDNLWAVRPVGTLGTHGWINGVPWAVFYVKARNADEAMRKYNNCKGKEGV